MYAQSLTNHVDFHVAMQDTLRKSNDLFHSRALLASLYTPKFTNRRVSDDLEVLDPKIRKNIISHPNAPLVLTIKRNLTY